MESQDLQKVVRELRSEVDCLLIRVDSCQRFIQKLFSLVGASFSPEKTKSVNSYSNSFEKNQSQRMSESKQLSGQIRDLYGNKTDTKLNEKTINWQVNEGMGEFPSIKDFLIYPITKQNKIQQLQTNSATLIKNAILINSQQIENIEEDFKILKENQEKRLQKAEEVLQLITKVVYEMQGQMRTKFATFMGLLGVGDRKPGRAVRKSISKVKPQYEMFSM